MAEVVPFDLNVHREIFVQLNVEFITWIADQFRENYQVDAVSIIGQTIPEYVDDYLPLFELQLQCLACNRRSLNTCNLHNY